MSNIIEKNKSFIIIGVGVLVVFGLFYYIRSKNRRLINYIDDLKQRIEDLEDILQKYENNKSNQQPNLAQYQAQNSRMNNSQPPQNISHHMGHLPRKPEPVKEPVKESVKEPVKEPVKESVKEPVKETVKEPVKRTNQTKHISFNTQVEELDDIDEDDDIDDAELDAELLEELKDLEENKKDDLKVE